MVALSILFVQIVIFCLILSAFFTVHNTLTSSPYIKEKPLLILTKVRRTSLPYILTILFLLFSILFPFIEFLARLNFIFFFTNIFFLLEIYRMNCPIILTKRSLFITQNPYTSEYALFALTDITKITITQNLFSQLLHYGTLSLTVKSHATPFILHRIHDPATVKRLIRELAVHTTFK